MTISKITNTLLTVNNNFKPLFNSTTVHYYTFDENLRIFRTIGTVFFQYLKCPLTQLIVCYTHNSLVLLCNQHIEII